MGVICIFFDLTPQLFEFKSFKSLTSVSSSLTTVYISLPGVSISLTTVSL